MDVTRLNRFPGQHVRLSTALATALCASDSSLSSMAREKKREAPEEVPDRRRVRGWEVEFIRSIEDEIV